MWMYKRKGCRNLFIINFIKKVFKNYFRNRNRKLKLHFMKNNIQTVLEKSRQFNTNYGFPVRYSEHAKKKVVIQSLFLYFALPDVYFQIFIPYSRLLMKRRCNLQNLTILYKCGNECQNTWSRRDLCTRI